MKKLLRKCAMLIALAGLFFVVLLVVAGLLARQTVTPDSLVALAEDQINSRVEIGEAELSLFRLPARITLRNVKLAPRDDQVGRPLAARHPLDVAPVRIEEVRLAVGLTALLKRRVEVKEFVFESPTMELVLYEEGGHSLDELLRPPGSVGRDRSEAGKKKKGKKQKRERKPEQEDALVNAESLNVYAHGFLGTLEDVRLEEGSLDLEIEKTGMLLKVRELQAELADLEIDPADLARTNAAVLEIGGRIEVDSSKDPDLRYAELLVQGGAGALLFDPASGDLDPELSARLALDERSYLNSRLPVVDKAWKAVRQVERFGLELGELPERATFGRGRVLAAHYHRERVTMKEPFSVWFADWELAVLADSWIQLEEGTHAAGAELLAREDLSGALRRQLGRGVEVLPDAWQPVLANEVERTWFRDGRLAAELASSGELGDPEVSVRNLLPDLGALLKRATGDLLPDNLSRVADDLLERLGLAEDEEDKAKEKRKKKKTKDKKAKKKGE